MCFARNLTEIMVTRRSTARGRAKVFPQQKHLPPSRDVHELFMDTGLGRYGYSSIGQGH